MAIRPSVPEIITVNSEELQTQIRDLLPSQNGFGSELQATNVITPIIDLTAAAEGSSLGVNLQTAIAFGSQTSFDVANTTTTLINSPGFYRIFGVASIVTSSASAQSGSFQLTDGLSSKIIWKVSTGAAVDEYLQLEFDFVVWLAAGESMSGTTNNAVSHLVGSTRQIASSDGTLIQPSGYPL